MGFFFYLVEVEVRFSSLQVKILLVPLIHPGQQFIKHMVVSLLLSLKEHSFSQSLAGIIRCMAG